MNYDAWMVIDDAGLDHRGFIIDNKIFKDIFDAETHTSISCELLALKVSRLLFKEYLKLGKKEHIVEVCVRIWGLPDVAYAEYKWNAGDRLPAAKSLKRRTPRNKFPCNPSKSLI